MLKPNRKLQQLTKFHHLLHQNSTKLRVIQVCITYQDCPKNWNIISTFINAQSFTHLELKNCNCMKYCTKSIHF